MILNKVYIAIAVGALTVGASSGYWLASKFCEADKVAFLEDQIEEIEMIREALGDAQDEAAQKKVKREVIYRDRIKYIQADAPECPAVKPDKLRELRCLTTPSTCDG
jgi:hypothetical protein